MIYTHFKGLLLGLILLLFSSTINAQYTFISVEPAVSGNLSEAQVGLLVKKFSGRPFEDFHDFCVSIYNVRTLKLTKEQRASIGNFALNREMSDPQREVIFRLLGIYAQLKYGGDALRSLRGLVSIPTVNDPTIAQHKNNNFLAAAKFLKKLASESSLKFRNVDNRVYEISFPWRKAKGELLALHAHVDVVPAEPKNWQLADGTQILPFKLTRVGDKLYGRGTQDDKNAIIVAIYAMRVISEEEIRLFNDIRLLIDTTEETSGEAMRYYLNKRPTPDYNIALDGAYPVVIAEKGFGIIKANFPIIKSGQIKSGDAVFTELSGGLAYNQIPAVSRAILQSTNAQLLAKDINVLADSFVQKYGGDFALQATFEGDLVTIELRGESAHSSEPESGVNPVSRMFLLISQLLDSKLLDRHPIQRNHITDAAHYAVQNWGLGYMASKIGVAYSDDFMGPLTASITKLGNDGKLFEVGVNLRIPVGKELFELETQIKTGLDRWKLKSGVNVNYSITTKAPMYRDPSGLWLKALQSIATESLSLSNKFASSAGGTSIHDLPNGVQFGLSMPNEKYTGHTALEHKTLDQFLVDLQIVTEMVARIGQMRRLD